MSVSGLESKVKQFCSHRSQALKNTTKKNFSDMRINLALSSAKQRMIQESSRSARRESSYMDDSPSHKISGFSSLPPLSEAEIQEAKNRWNQALLSAIPEENEALKEKVRSGQITPGHLAGSSLLNIGNIITREEKLLLQQAVSSLSENSEEQYYKIIKENPFLAWIKSPDPSDLELTSALTEMEDSLEKLLKDLKNPETAPESLLLSFKPLVEELLTESTKKLCENKPDTSCKKEQEDFTQCKERELRNCLWDTDSPYCLSVARAKVKADKEPLDMFSIAAGLIVLPSCFMGVIGLTFCVTAEFGLLAREIKQQEEDIRRSMGLTIMEGKDLESLAEESYSQSEFPNSTTHNNTYGISKNSAIQSLKEAESDKDLSLALAPLLLLDVPGILTAVKIGKKTLKP